MKIGVIIPNSQISEESLEDRVRFLMEYAQTATEIMMVKLVNGPISVESSFEHEQAGYYMAKKVRELEKEGFDAFIPWCGEDAGLVSAREITRVPVIGPFQSSCSIAIMLGHKFSIIGPMVQRAFMERQVWGLGLGSRLASIRSFGIPVIEVQKNRKKAHMILKEECEKAVHKDGADIVILSCMALFGLAHELTEKIDVPVIDPALAALKAAETLISLSLTHSETSYPLLPK